MSHHSVESMRDVAFRKGRHGFSSDDDYLRALRGEELEDEPLDEEDEPLDKEDEPLDEEDEPLDEEDESLDEEDETPDEDEAVFDFEDIIFDAMLNPSSRVANTIFDWIMKVEAGGRPGALTFAYGDTTVTMSVVGEDLVFETTCGGQTTRGQYGFEYFLTDVQDTLTAEDSRCHNVCDTVEDVLGTARRLGYADVWKKDIARFLAGCQSNLELHATRGGKDTRLRFVRRPLKGGDTIWVLLNPTAPDTELKDETGHPARLLQWLFERNGLIDVLRPE